MYEGMTISQFYESDHDRLDGLFKKFQQSRLSDFGRACEFFDEFKLGLQRHIIWEEEILFPYFEEKTGMSFSQPVYVMKLEHRQIGRLLELIHNKLREGDPNTDREEQELLSFLGHHNIKEEVILYPAIDQAATRQDIEAILTAMNELPQEKYFLQTETA